MKEKKAGFIVMAFVVATLFSCKHDIPVNPAVPGDTTGTGGICFESDILPIFQSNCAKSGCHDAVSRKENYQLDTYANIVSRGIRAGNAANSKIYEVITETDPSNIMPEPPNAPLTAAQINLIGTWINEGARNTTNCSAACDSTRFTYSAAVKPILQTHCLGCHSGVAAAGGFIPLDNYLSVKEQVTFNTLYPAITHTGANPMPKNGNKLNDCKITAIRKWIEAGAPNN